MKLGKLAIFKCSRISNVFLTDFNILLFYKVLELIKCLQGFQLHSSLTFVPDTLLLNSGDWKMGEGMKSD
jgi:hypothetical protein